MKTLFPKKNGTPKSNPLESDAPAGLAKSLNACKPAEPDWLKRDSAFPMTVPTVNDTPWLLVIVTVNSTSKTLLAAPGQ